MFRSERISSGITCCKCSRASKPSFAVETSSITLIFQYIGYEHGLLSPATALQILSKMNIAADYDCGKIYLRAQLRARRSHQWYQLSRARKRATSIQGSSLPLSARAGKSSPFPRNKQSSRRGTRLMQCFTSRKARLDSLSYPKLARKQLWAY